MRKTTAIAGNIGFLVFVAVMTGLVPWWITHWQTGNASYPVLVQVIGWLVIGLGAAVMIAAFAQFALTGLGTPLPKAPPERLVVNGIYRYLRNPIYLSVVAVIVGQALVLSRPVLFGYAIGMGLAFFAYYTASERGTLANRYGDQYESYLRTAPRWWPRLPHTRAKRPSDPSPE